MSESLRDSGSPFLRHGAGQPIGWLPWGAAAFERARREEKPILLDIGAVWCHWCHVMDHESYEDEETARLINDLFVPVKVDRDERPDVDARYQRAVQALSGQGGWPLTAFLTPDGEVYYGGTYFPPSDRFGRPSFRRVLAEVARVWREDRERVLETARTLRERLTAHAAAEAEPGKVSARLVADTLEGLARSFDFRHGGFGGAPKFPNAPGLALLLDRHLDQGEDWTRRVVTETLDAMARGGVYDQLGGGFHRYSVDARWLVPHFEKMAYDNGVLLELYSRAYAVWGTPRYRAAVEGILDHYRELAPDLLAAGGFPASQDADIGPQDDGDYWTWTLEEVQSALSGDERLVRAARLHYGLDDPDSSMHLDPARHVLYLALDAAGVARRMEVDDAAAERMLGEIRARLKTVRDGRPRPFVDETLYASWVGLVASGHLAAARFLGRVDAAETALGALDRIWAEAFDPERGVARRVGAGGTEGYLEDQAHVAQALVDAFEYTQRPEYLERAIAVLDLMLDRFRDPAGGALLDRPPGGDGSPGVLDEPHRPVLDSPEPSGNAVAALTLLRVAALLHSSAYRDRARAILDAFGGSIPGLATAACTYVRAVDWATAPVTTVAIVEAGGDDADSGLLRAALATHRPRTVVRRFEAGAVRAEQLPPELAAMVTGASPRAYVCAGQTCAAPAGSAEELVELLRSFRG